ncbi:hypothetical protein INT43_006902 [Umbelopsis isabellina]|uniref:Beta-catenin-like protein 1 N-terminal domain-containing protein n=1 Tax=Mortierella isabellina TaxID=91625 RepID=A0A8H7PXK6_MORIS|nr:hypothetical protein INT43_006902 [Umbelopsis isabellina]
MNIDELFKIPAIPSGKNKRKLPDNPSMEFLDKYKEASRDDEGEGSSAKRRNIMEEDTDEAGDYELGEDDYDNGEADEEEGGRFYGGGLTDEQRRMLELVDEIDAEEPEALDAATVKKYILRFEKAINKNQEQRVKYPDNPEKFMESEADLDEEIKNLLSLTQAPQHYHELVNLGSVPSLLSLLSHENTDIALDAIELLNELTDEDVGPGEDFADEEKAETIIESIKIFVDALIENQLPELLVQNLQRLDENEAADRQGVFNILSVFENLVSVFPRHSEHIVAKTDLLPWLLKRINTKVYDSNRGYACEIIAILLQDSRDNRVKFGELGGIDVLLRVLSAYKRKDPADDDEAEMMENFFTSLCSALAEPEIKKLFLEGEGVELMLIMIKQVMSRIRAVKVLDYALSTPAGTGNCYRFVESFGLKTLFSMFMRKGIKKLKKAYKAYSESEEEEHLLGIIISLFKNLPQDDVQQLRLVQKFSEDNYEKVDRLFDLLDQYEARDKAVQQEIATEKEELDEEDLEEMEDQFYIRRLDAGLFTLQRVYLTIHIVCEENDGARDHATMLLKRRDMTLSDLSAFIEADDALLKEMDTVRGPVLNPIVQNGDLNKKTQNNDVEMPQAEQAASVEAL